MNSYMDFHTWCLEIKGIDTNTISIDINNLDDLWELEKLCQLKNLADEHFKQYKSNSTTETDTEINWEELLAKETEIIWTTE